MHPIKQLIAIFFILLLAAYMNAQSQSTKEQQSNNPLFGQNNENLNNFTGNIYYVPDNTVKLPDFKKIKPVGSIYTPEINISDQDFYKGFPGITNCLEYFAIDYTGSFYLADSCSFWFQLCSDDGSKLFIDNQLVINNDYQHGMLCIEKPIALKPGMHAIEVQYFQGPKFRLGLTLYYRKDFKSSFEPFNLRNFAPLTINEREREIEVSIGAEVLFAFDSFTLGDAVKTSITDLKRLVIDRKNIQTIIIEGHTDDKGSEAYNLKLSENRAQAVKDYLVSLGCNANAIQTKGYGESKPSVTNTDENNRRQNRRIEITLVKAE